MQYISEFYHSLITHVFLNSSVSVLKFWSWRAIVKFWEYFMEINLEMGSLI